MSDNIDRYLEDVEAIGASLGMPDEFARLRALLAQLPDLTQPQVQPVRAGYPDAEPGGTGIGAALSLSSGTPIGHESGTVLGIMAELFYGKSNYLEDPLFEKNHTINPIGSAFGGGGNAIWWDARYILNSGTAPAGRSWSDDYLREDPVSNPFNTNAPALFVDINASTNVEFLIKETQSATDRAQAPFLVASCRVGILNSVDFVNLTTATAQIEIVDSSGNVLASSTAFNLLSLVLDEDSVRLTCAYDGNTVGHWQLRIKLVASGGTPNVYISVGEPQLVRSSIQAPPPFSPIVGAWNPAKLDGRFQTTADRLWLSTLVNELNARFAADMDGLIEWGPGGSSAQDTDLFRSGVGELTTSGDLVVGGALTALTADMGDVTLEDVIFNTLQSDNGASKFMQTGTVAVDMGGNASATQGVTFPTAFDNAPIVLVTRITTSGTSPKVHMFVSGNPSTTGFTAGAATGDGTTSANTLTARWLAIDFTHIA